MMVIRYCEITKPVFFVFINILNEISMMKKMGLSQKSCHGGLDPPSPDSR
jgi:hypothetical protein